MVGDGFMCICICILDLNLWLAQRGRRGFLTWLLVWFLVLLSLKLLFALALVLTSGVVTVGLGLGFVEGGGLT